MSCLYPTGRARSTRTSCPSTPSATMFSAAAASPPPPSPTPFYRHRPVPSGRSALLGRAGPAPPALRGQCGPLRADRALGVRNRHTLCRIHLLHSEYRIEGEDGTCRQDAEPRGCSGYPIGICRQLPGSRRDILQDILQEVIQDILRGYPTECTHHPHRISCKDISCRVSYRIQDILLGYLWNISW